VNNPALHPLALAVGLKAERMSHLCEDILIARALEYGALQDGLISADGRINTTGMEHQIDDKVQHAFSDPTSLGYEYET